MDKEALIGKWAAYWVDEGCCAGFGKIVGINLLGFIEVDEYPGDRYKTAVPEQNIEDFETAEEASERFHKDDEKRSAQRFKRAYEERF